MNHYQVLGVPNNASTADIKSAYRRLAQRAHPDKGGDPEQFQAIQKAYETLSDDDRRAHYDKTGSDEQEPSIKDFAFQKLAELFASLIDQSIRGDLIEIGRNRITEAKSILEASKLKKQKELEKQHKLIDRIQNKAGSENIFSMVVQSKIDNLKEQIESAEKEELLLAEILVLLNEHEDTSPDILPPRTFGQPYFDVSHFIRP